jgi:ATP-dependent Lon protease
MHGERQVDPLKQTMYLDVTSMLEALDGSSSSVVMAAGLVAFCLGWRVRRDAIATGELSLTGSILSVGGIHEKLLAVARQSRIIKRVIVPGKQAVGEGQS